MTSQFVIVKSHKSVGIAIILTLLFGPIGVFYASVTGGIILTFIVPAIFFALIYFGIFQSVTLFITVLAIGILIGAFYWLICMAWAIIAVNDYNRDLDESFRMQEVLKSLEKEPAELYPLPTISNQISSNTIESTSTERVPTLEEWRRDNPHKGINDYFAIYKR